MSQKSSLIRAATQSALGKRPFEPKTPEQIYLGMYPTNHLFILSPTNPFRRFCVYVSTSKPFDYFILATIAFNCILLALNSPLPYGDKSNINMKLEMFENPMLYIFIGEAFFKIIAQGFMLHQDAYIRNAWNILDFTVVVTGILGMPEINLFANKAGAMNIIKAARVLRPLKLVSGVPSLQVVMSGILKSMASLLQICLLISFVIVIYAIIAMSCLINLFHYTCFYKNTTIIAEYGRLCGVKDGRQCPPDQECKEYWDGPNNGVTCFDHILIACLTVFTCITCEGWTETMYLTFDVFDRNGSYFWLYYYTLNVIGAQFMLNLVCGVLSGEFSKEKERVENRTLFMAEIAAEMSAQRSSKYYNGWIDKGELLYIKEQAQQLKQIEEEEEDDTTSSSTNSLSRMERFKLKNNIFRAKLKKVMLSQTMLWLVIFLVFCNSVASAAHYYRQPQWLSDLITISDHMFLAFFFMEMCLKLYSMGPSLYFSGKFNTFDFVVVISGVANLILSKVYNIDFGIPILRQLRLMRLFKFTRYWTSLKTLMVSILASLTSIMSLLLLLALFLMIFALLGMHLFGGAFRNKIPPARTNFDDFFNAILAVFQIITGEDWNYVMYDGIVASGGPRTAEGLASSLYFVGVTVLGNYVLLNVFLAIAVDNLTMTSEEENQIASEEQDKEEHMKQVREQYADPTKVSVIEKTEEQNVQSNAIQPDEETTPLTDDNPSSAENVDDDNDDVPSEFTSAPIEGGKKNPGQNFLENLKNPGRMTGNMWVSAGTPMLQENTLFICFPANPIRKVVHKIVASKHFDNIILALIMISSGLLAMEDATDPNATINLYLRWLDYGFTSVFALEVVLKIINFGLILHPGSYCRDSWNCTDMFVVICAITSLVLSHNKNSPPTVKSVVKILRILRVMRPLKSINKLPKLKAVFQCMIYSLKNVVNILAITLQFLFIFSVMGVQLFNGKLYRCNDPSKEWEDDCQGTFISFDEFNYNRPKEIPRVWSVMSFNFDNCAGAMLSLFTSSTGEGWPGVMQSGIDSQNQSQGPLTNNKIWVAAYFIVFVVIFSFFFINVFVGLVILTFQEQGAAEASVELDRNAKNSLQFTMTVKPLKRFMPEDLKSFQYKAWTVIESNAWEIIIMTLIALNTVVLMVEFHDQPEVYKSVVDKFNDAFSFIFTIEFAVKIYALRLNYFKDFWNNFDLFLVVGSLLDFIMKQALPPDTLLFDPRIFRLCRAARLIKLLRRSRSLRILLWTFFQSFKALPYVGMLIFLLFFVYGIIGVQIFALITIESQEEPWAQINRNNNFRTYFAATQVLFRVATGENWPNIMLACSYKAECDKSLPAYQEGYEYCGSNVAYPYFISFVFFSSFLMLNLFIAVIMDNFAFLTEDSSILGPHHLDEFVTVWSDFDPRATGRINHDEIGSLLKQICSPLGLGTKCPKVVLYRRLVQMNMTLYRDGTVDFSGTMFALVRTGLGIHTENDNLKSNWDSLRKMLIDTWPNISKRTINLVITKPPRSSTSMTIAKIYSAKLLWENYKTMKFTGRRDAIYSINNQFLNCNKYKRWPNGHNGIAHDRVDHMETSLTTRKKRKRDSYHLASTSEESKIV